MLGALEWAWSPHLLVESFIRRGLVPDRSFSLSEDHGVVFPFRPAPQLARRVEVSHVKSEESSTGSFPADPHRRMLLSDGAWMYI
jgi:hypothetical protein